MNFSTTKTNQNHNKPKHISQKQFFKTTRLRIWCLEIKKKKKLKDEPSFKRSMQRGSSRLKASIFLNSSSNPLRKESSLESFSETLPIIETSLRKSVIVFGTKFVGLKSKLSSGGTEPISQNSKLFSYPFP